MCTCMVSAVCAGTLPTFLWKKNGDNSCTIHAGARLRHTSLLTLATTVAGVGGVLGLSGAGMEGVAFGGEYREDRGETELEVS